MLLAVLRSFLVKTVACCSLASSSPVASTGATAVPATVSQVVIAGAAILNFWGTGSGASIEYDLASNTLGTSMVSKTLFPALSGFTLPLIRSALGVTVVPATTDCDLVTAS